MMGVLGRGCDGREGNSRAWTRSRNECRRRVARDQAEMSAASALYYLQSAALSATSIFRALSQLRAVAVDVTGQLLLCTLPGHKRGSRLKSAHVRKMNGTGVRSSINPAINVHP